MCTEAAQAGGVDQLLPMEELLHRQAIALAGIVHANQAIADRGDDLGLAPDAGVAMVYSYQAAHHIADGRLEVILSDYEIDPLPVSFIYPQGELVPQKVRAFIDFAMPRLREHLGIVSTQCSQ